MRTETIGPTYFLQRLQNRAARIVLRRDSSKDTFNALGWAELETKRKRHK